MRVLGERRRACARPVRLAGIVAAALAACARAPAKIEREPFSDAPIRSMPADDVRRRVDVSAADVTHLRGKLDLALRERADGAFRTCRGALAARSPWADPAAAGLYLQGHRGPLPTLFTLVSDGRDFWLHVPSENVVYTGPIARPREAGGPRAVPLDVRDLFRAMFVQPLAAPDEVSVAEEPATWVVSVVHDGQVRRRLWVDRRGLVVRREVYLDADGRPELSIERDRWLEVGSRRFPGRIVLTDAVTGSAVRLEFESVALDPPDLDARAFRPRVPREARVERVAGLGEGERAP
jgi:hypothetical protein